MRFFFQALIIVVIVIDGIYGGRPGRRQRKNPSSDGGLKNDCQAASYITENGNRTSVHIFGCGKEFQKEMDNFQKKFTIPIFKATIFYNKPANGDSIEIWHSVGSVKLLPNIESKARIVYTCYGKGYCEFDTLIDNLPSSISGTASIPFHTRWFSHVGEVFKDTKNNVFVEVLF